MKNIFCVKERHSKKGLYPHNVVFGWKTERFLFDVNSAHCKFIRMRLKYYLEIYFSTNQFLIFCRLHYFLHLHEDKGEIATLLKHNMHLFVFRVIIWNYMFFDLDHTWHKQNMILRDDEDSIQYAVYTLLNVCQK